MPSSRNNAASPSSKRRKTSINAVIERGNDENNAPSPDVPCSSSACGGNGDIVDMSDASEVSSDASRNGGHNKLKLVQLQLRHRDGQCPTCGMATFTVSGSMRTPINNAYVMMGRCLLCFPLPSNTTRNPSFPAAAPPTPPPCTVPPAAAPPIPPLSTVPPESSPPAAPSNAQSSTASVSLGLEQPDTLLTTGWENLLSALTSPTGKRFNSEWHGLGKNFGCGSYTGEFDDEGNRHGRGVFDWDSSPYLDVNNYEKGVRTGEGVRWSGKTSWRFEGNRRKGRITLKEAEAIADRIGIPIKRFEDYRMRDRWGSYTGEIDDDGNRHGRGVMKWDNGTEYDGEWTQNKKNGRGTQKYNDGVYDGEWKGDEKHGKGTYRFANGEVDISIYDYGEETGEGVQWSADRRSAWRLEGGRRVQNITMATAIADHIGIPVPI